MTRIMKTRKQTLMLCLALLSALPGFGNICQTADSICPTSDNICQPSDSIRQSSQQLLLQKGDSCEQQYDTYHALHYYEAAMQLCATPATIRKVAYCQYKRGHFEECIRLLERVEQDSIDHRDMKTKYNCYDNLALKDSALYWGNRLLERYPNDDDMVAKLAHYYNEALLPDSALRYTESYRQTDSTNIFVNRQHAFAYYQKGEFGNALAEYRKLLELNDRTASVYYYAGLCYAKCDSIGEAYDCLLEAARQHHFNHPHVLAQLGIVSIEASIPEGIEYVQKAIELLQPDDLLMFTLNNAIANGYLKRLKFEPCIRYLKTCLQYNPNHTYTLYKLAQAYGYMKDTAHEKLYYQKFIEQAEQKKQVSDSMGALIVEARMRVKKIKEEDFFKGSE